MPRKNTLKGTLIGILVIVLSLCVILLAELIPLWSAKRSFQKDIRYLQKATDIAYISVSDPLAQTGDILLSGTEYRIEQSEKASAAARALADCLSGFTLKKREDASAGDWDLRVRICPLQTENDQKTPIDFFFRTDGVYISNGKVRFIFTGAEGDIKETALALLETFR